MSDLPTLADALMAEFKIEALGCGAAGLMSPQKEMVVGRTLLRATRREQIAGQGIRWLERTAFFKHFGNYISDNFRLAKQLFSATDPRQHVNDKRPPLGPHAIVNVGEVTYELMLPKIARRVEARGWSRRKAHVESVSGAVDERSRLTGLNEYPSAMTTLLGVSLQRSTPVALAICATTVSERDAEREEREGSRPGVATPEMAFVESVRGEKLGSVLDQLSDFVGKFFDLFSRLVPAFYREGKQDSNKLILRPDSVVDINERADGSATIGKRASIQRYMEGFTVRSVDYRRVPGESNERFAAVLAPVGVSLQGEDPSSAAILQRTLKQLEISFHPGSLGTTAAILALAAWVPAGPGGFPPEAAGGGQRVLAGGWQRLFRLEFASSISFPKVRGGGFSPVSQKVAIG